MPKIDPRASFDVAAKHLFRHLHDPRALRKNPLVAHFFAKPSEGSEPARSREAIERIHWLVLNAAEHCRDEDLRAGDDERALRQYAIVSLQCIERRPILEVAATLGISPAHCYRERALIARRVARYIADHGDVPSLNYVPEVDEFGLLASRAQQRAAFGDAKAAFEASDDLVRAAPSAQQRIEALRISASVSAQFGDVARSQRAYAGARALFQEHLADVSSSARDIALAHLDLIALELALNAGDTKGALRMAQSATSTLERTAEAGPPRLRELYVESLANSGIALANLGDFETGFERVARAETLLSQIRPASANLRSWIMVEGWRGRNRLLTSSRYWQPSWQRIEALTKAFELAYDSGMLLVAIRALVALAEHHAFAGNDREVLRAARSAMVLARQYPSSRVGTQTAISVVLPLLLTRHWEEGAALLPTPAQLDSANAYYRGIVSYCAATQALRARAFGEAWALASRDDAALRNYPGVALRMRLVATAAAHELHRRDAHALLEETLPAAEEHGSAPILRDAYGLAAEITGDSRLRGQAGEIARLLTA